MWKSSEAHFRNFTSDYSLLIVFLCIHYLPKLFNEFVSILILFCLLLYEENIPFYISKKSSKIMFMYAEYACHNLFSHPLILEMLLCPNFSFLGKCNENPCICPSMYITDCIVRIHFSKRLS